MAVFLMVSYAVLLCVLSSPNDTQERERFVTAAFNKVQENEWPLCDLCDFPVSVAFNSSPGSADVPSRTAYLLIDTADFTEDNLTQVFVKFAAKYPDPKSLYITAFSDRQMVQCLVLANTRPVSPTADEEARQECYELRRTRKLGYFRAYYIRSRNGEESFQYNPNPAVDKFITIKLKDRTDKNYTGDPNSDLRLAAEKGDSQNVLKLLVLGANVNSKDWQGNTALMRASNEYTVKILLDHGADVDARNNYGVTALIAAAGLGRRAIVEALLWHGARINLKDNYGYTALMKAGRSGDVPVVSILLARGADATIKDDFGRTAMMLAREHGRTEVIRHFEAVGIQK